MEDITWPDPQEDWLEGEEPNQPQRRYGAEREEPPECDASQGGSQGGAR